LKVDSKTNNTSLVLAFELTETEPRKVLLFVGDAQVGNWLSWQEVRWENEGVGGTPVSGKDLLSRTALYKVGHHGSHNATLKAKGLELMENPELVAMIPVDEDWANDSMHWEHPAKKLYERLEQKTKGRIIRTDEIPGGNEPPSKPLHISKKAWDDFCKNLDWDKSGEDLWIQYKIPIS
jgi:beta-lactamase superfamily II metal-dependent hydrolase